MGYKPHSIKDRSILQLLLVDNSKSYEKPKAVQRRREKRFKLCLVFLVILPILFGKFTWRRLLKPAGLGKCWSGLLATVKGIQLILFSLPAHLGEATIPLQTISNLIIYLRSL